MHIALSRHYLRLSLFIFLLLFGPFNAGAIILDIPVPGVGFSALMTNYPATAYWTLQPGDTPLIILLLRNNVTFNSFKFATQVQTSGGSITRNLTNVPGSEFYFMQAIDFHNTSNVLASSGLFTVAGSIAGSRATSSSQSSSGTNSQHNVAIALFVICGLLSVAIVVAFAFYYYYYHRRRRLQTQTDSPSSDTFIRTAKNRPRAISLDSIVMEPVPRPARSTSLQSNRPAVVSGHLRQVPGEHMRMQRIPEGPQELQVDTARNRTGDEGLIEINSVAFSLARQEHSGLRNWVELANERIGQLECQQRRLASPPPSNRGGVELPPDYVAVPGWGVK